MQQFIKYEIRATSDEIMAHQHLHFKENLAVEHTHGKQIRVSLAMVGTLAGGMLLISSSIARFIYGKGSFNPEFLAMVAAILLGAPIVLHAIKSIIQRHSRISWTLAETLSQWKNNKKNISKHEVLLRFFELHRKKKRQPGPVNQIKRQRQ